MFSDPNENISKLDLALGQSVVDVGVGSGHHTIIIAKKVGKEGKVYAVEVQKELLSRLKNEAAKDHIHNIEIVLGNAEKLGGTRLEDAIADRILVSNVLFQIEDKQNFVKELKRLLKPGGRLVLIDWNRGIGGKSHDTMVVGPLEATHIFTQAGFKRLEEFEAGDHHYGIIFNN